MSESVSSEVNSFLLLKRDFKSGKTLNSTDVPKDEIDTRDDNSVVSVFRFSRPSWWNDKINSTLKTSKTAPNSAWSLEDDDGDLDVPRRSENDEHPEELYLEIEHQLSSSLHEVGMQIWRGSLVMADYLIQERDALLQQKFALEIGSGVGLVSIVASLCGVKRIVATDLDILMKTIQNNFARNLSYEVDISSAVLDLKAFNDDQFNNVDIVIGADVIYDFDLTDGIIETVKKVICCRPFKPKIFLFSVEKRFIFSLDVIDTVAPAFDYFVTLLEHLKSDLISSEGVILSIDFVPLDLVKQSFCYERTKDLKILKVVSAEKN